LILVAGQAGLTIRGLTNMACPHFCACFLRVDGRRALAPHRPPIKKGIANAALRPTSPMKPRGSCAQTMENSCRSCTNPALSPRSSIACREPEPCAPFRRPRPLFRHLGRRTLRRTPARFIHRFWPLRPSQIFCVIFPNPGPTDGRESKHPRIRDSRSRLLFSAGAFRDAFLAVRNIFAPRVPPKIEASEIPSFRPANSFLFS